jgi:hypothetical protein
MAFTEFEEQVNQRAIADFMAKRRPPEHIRPRLDIGVEENGQAIEIFSIVPHYKFKSELVRQNIARIRFYRSRDEWQLYWQRADLRWHLYEPDLVHHTLHHALKVIDADEHCCFFG